MQAFEYNGNPSRVIFGSGTIDRVPAELERLKVTTPLVLSTPEQAEQARRLASTLENAQVFTGATMHTPIRVTEQALQFATHRSIDGVVSLGGGSTIGLGKALSVRTGWPHLCIPTTYAGSEMTPILGEQSEGQKLTRRDPKILPSTVIYDVNLTLTLPPSLSATSGVNALAHAVEALYAPNTNPIISLLAVEGAQSFANGLPGVIESPGDKASRELVLYGAWLCGVCLGSTDMSLHHKLCHTLGGSLNLPHAETHTIMLPHTFAYNATAAPDTAKRLAGAFAAYGDDAVSALNKFLDQLGVKRALKDFGMKEEDIDKVAELATKNPYSNPRPVELGLIREVIRRAWAGEHARADL
ncbi:putative maleylacetate reductase [Pyrenochaeta sp. MPI-SDFR-AT-0127]|nr:putative maleylacetate reductase [Pyrenochaeta sp. MPI-SDFR-AT-0127]